MSGFVNTPGDFAFFIPFIVLYYYTKTLNISDQIKCLPYGVTAEPAVYCGPNNDIEKLLILKQYS